MKLDDINDVLDTKFDSDDYDSIGGIMIELLDRFPAEGESVTTDNGITLTAKSVDNNRIETVVILLPEPETPPEEDAVKPDSEDEQQQ